MNDKEKIKALVNLINDICCDVRERYVQDDVCGLCEFDCDHGLDGYARECPGFETDRCFRLKDDFLKKYTPDSPRGKDREYVDKFGMTQEAMKRTLWNVKNLICEVYDDINERLEETGAAEQIREDYEIPKDEEIFKPHISSMTLFMDAISCGTPYGGSTSAMQALKDIGMTDLMSGKLEDIKDEKDEAD